MRVMATRPEIPEAVKNFCECLDAEGAYFTPSLGELLTKLQESWSQENTEKVQQLCHLGLDLLQGQRDLRDPRVNLSYLEGLLGAYQGAVHWAGGKFKDAEAVFRHSSRYLVDSGVGHYNAGVVQMALGEILQRQGRLREALRACQQSLYFSRWSSAPKCDLLCDKVMKEFDSICNRLCEGAADGVKPDRPAATTDHSKPVQPGSQKLLAFPVMGLASAGALTLTSDAIEGYGCIETLTIDDALYNFYPLEAGRDVYLRLHYHYVISPVEGDSMNRTAIQDGDRVLFERPVGGTYVPEDGDIVLAITSSGETVKRYRQKGGDVWLQPESSNTSYELHWMFRQGKPVADQGPIRIVAKVVAVLKEI